MGFCIAIDGPAGAGKSSVSKLLAKELGFIYVDTGAMYRAIGLYILRKGISPDDERKIEGIIDEIGINIEYIDGGLHIILNDEDVTSLIRTQEVSDAASKSSVFKAVRAKLLSLQRELAKKNDVIMDGRDIGTAVLPNAELKIYLTAGSHVRAERRYKELIEKGIEAELSVIEKEIIERDTRDMSREIAPLKQADDAILVNTDDMTLQEVVLEILRLTKTRRNTLE